MITLRKYQTAAKADVYAQWGAGHRNTLLVMPTGAGKTVTMASVSQDMLQQTGPGVVIAHRKELVSQIAMTHARFGIPHRIIAADETVRMIIQEQVKELGRQFVSDDSTLTVGSIDTIKARAAKLAQWAQDQRFWQIDEAHHVLQGNKWGSGVAMFPNAFGLGVTATPLRADNKSLHRDQGGVFDAMVVGPNMRQLIDMGRLCDYRIFCPPPRIDESHLKVGSTGDFTQKSLSNAARETPQIVGDVVDSYLQHAAGKRGITFAADVQQAKEIAAQFNARGVPAAAVDGDTPSDIRNAAIDKFRRGVLLQLVNVDLFGEGFDVPAVEVVSMVRHTASFGLYCQQFGRALRTMDGKSHGIIIDHVSNVVRHGLPDAPRRWTLWNEERGNRKDPEPATIRVARCTACFRAYEVTGPACPHCGHRPEPESRGRPEHVDGDLIELDAATLAQMRAAVDDIDAPADWTPRDAREGAMRNNYLARQDAQADLRRSIAEWSHLWHDRGADDSEIYRRFFGLFGVDMLTAQAMAAPDARKLTDKINSMRERTS